jgi:cytochrome c-type biogenesis protein CcsB
MNPLESNLNLLVIIILGVMTISAWSRSLFIISDFLQSFHRWALYGATFCLTILLLQRWIAYGHIPLSNLYESSLALSWLILMLSLIFQKSEWSLLVMIPTAWLLELFAAFTLPSSIANSAVLVPALQSNWLMMHVSMMISSYALLIIGAMLSIMWLIMNLRAAQLNLTEQFCFVTRQSEMLTKLDYWSYRLISVGFPLLTIGIISGAVWANEVWGSYWSWDPKETWAFLTWMIFALYLHTRLNSNLHDRQKTALTATVGLAIVWMCYLGVNLLGKGLHSYGWFE